MRLLSRFAPRTLSLAVGLAIALPAATALAADAWPERQIQVIVPYTPAGSTDAVTRIVMQKLAERLGQPIVVENRPGANSLVGTAQAARAKPDGYTFVTVLAAYTVNPHLYPLQYKQEDFTPVSHLADLPLFLFVNRNLPVNSVSELIEYGRKNPGKLTYASSGTGSSAHMTGANFALVNGLEMTHIPYKGSAPILTDLLGGQLSMVFDPAIVPMPYAKKGELKVLGLASAERWQVAPEVPTLVEQGVKDFVMNSWVGLLAPAGTPQPIVDRMSRELAEVVKDPDVQQRFANAGFVPRGSTPAEFGALIEKDLARYGEIVKATGTKVE